MKSIQDTLNAYKEEFSDSELVLESLYQENFGGLFSEAKEMFVKMEQSSCPITDPELEWILTILPMKLFDVSEKINKLRLDLEVVKLKMKEKRYQMREESQLPGTKAQEYAVIQTTQDEVISTVLSSLITRVENEVSFSRELIMGAKKVWDSRRRSEESMPVSPVQTKEDSTPLPEYRYSPYRDSVTISEEYIK